jgi:hypothetical protein
MVARGTDGIYRTQPVETPSNGGGTVPVVATDIMDPEASARWNAWWDQRFAVENESWCQTVAEATMTLIHQRVAPLERRVKDLEFQLAEARGAIDVLRGRGAPGALRVCGTYIPDALYLANDVVARNGSSFVALKDRPGDCPGDGWQLLASAGKRGPKGERGLQGHTGAAAKVRWLSIDNRDRLALVVTMSDGTSTKLPLAGIFKSVYVDPSDYSIKFAMHDGGELSFSLRSLFQQYDDEKRAR